VKAQDRYLPSPRSGVATRPTTCPSRQENLAQSRNRGRREEGVVLVCAAQATENEGEGRQRDDENGPL
jgi:hypothetical protein